MVRPEEYGDVKLKGILFGDDTLGTVIDEAPAEKNKRGVMVKAYLIKPHSNLIKQYPELQKPNALNVPTRYGRAVWKEYPTYWIDDRNPSRTNAIVRIDCGFDGRETLQTSKRSRLADENRELQEEMETMKLSNMYLNDEVKGLLLDKKEILKELAEMASMIKPSGSYSGGGEDGREE